jgi:arylsulfatase A-like enzyme
VHYDDYDLSSPGQIFASSTLGAYLEQRRWFRRTVRLYDMLGRKTAEEVNRAFLDWLPKTSGRPFFVFLNYFDAHAPYRPPAPFDTAFSPEDYTAPSGSVMRPERLKETQACYDGGIAYQDAHLRALLAELRARGYLDDTIVVVTSDHGELFGEHGLVEHGNSLYMDLLGVPLIVSSPKRVPAGLEIREGVTPRDLPATIMDLAGYSTAPFPGTSLARFWTGRAPAVAAHSPVLAEAHAPPNPAPWAPLAKGAMKSIVQGPYHYIWRADGTEELYDVDKDPKEDVNLTGPEFEATRRELRIALQSGTSAPTQVARSGH